MDVYGDANDGSGSPADGADDELLSSGREPRNRRGRIVTATAVLALAALGVVLLIVQYSERSARVAAPAPSTRAPSTTAVPPPPPPARDEAAVAMIGQFLYIVRDGNLYMEDAISPVRAQVNIGQSPRPGAQYLLVADAASRRIWVVQSLSRAVTVYEYDPASLVEISVIDIEGDVADAAVLLGDLYLSTDIGVMRFSGPSSGRFNVTPVRGAQAVAADPSRRRLVLLDVNGRFPRVRAQRPAESEPIVDAKALFVKGGLAVVDGQIWAGGYGIDGAVLVRLDPRTLRPAAHSPLERRLGAGAQIVSAGIHDLLVRGGAGGDALWCVDARSGAAVQSWRHATGPVVLPQELDDQREARAYSVPAGTTPRVLPRGGCAG